MNGVIDRVTKSRPNIWAEASNRTADEWRNGKLDKFNSTHYGSSTYESDYFKLFDEDFQRNYKIVTREAIEADPGYRKAKALCDKYSMTTFDELARKNEEYMRGLNG